MVWPRTIHRLTTTLITGSTRLPPTPHRVDFSAGNDVDRNQTPAAISGGLSSRRSPASATADLHRSDCLGVVGSAAGTSARLDTGNRLVKTPNAAPRNRKTTTRPRDHPKSVHVVMVYKCSTNRRRRFLVRRLRRSPLSPPGRPGRATAAVAAVRTTIDETNARRVPTPPIRRVTRSCSMVVLPYLPSPLARSIPSYQTDRSAPPSFRQHKTRSSICFVFRPRHAWVAEKTRARPINVQ
jgi:hypothetical protein